MRTTRTILIVLAALIVVLIGAVLVVPSLIPSEVYRAEIAGHASAALGRAVEIKGPVRLSVLPSIEARATSVTIANAEGFSDGPLAQADELRAKLALWPLLQ